MGFLSGLFGKNDEIQIGAPTAGSLIPLAEVSDPTFSGEILGKGAAVIPADGKFCAPADGVVATIFPTGHAAAVKTKNGVNVLLHIGIDTVKLQGKYFTIHVEEGRQVKKGDLLIEADLEKIRAAGYETVTPVVICNSGDFQKIRMAETGEVTTGDTMLLLKR